MKLVIDRKRWYRGKGEFGGENPRMLNEHGKMCCLGFLALACGYGASDIDDQSDPEEAAAEAEENKFPPGFCNTTTDEEEDEDGDFDMVTRYHNTELTKKLIRTNDSGQMTEEQREAEVARLMKMTGVEVEFVDEPREDGAA